MKKLMIALLMVVPMALNAAEIKGKNAAEYDKKLVALEKQLTKKYPCANVKQAWESLNLVLDKKVEKGQKEALSDNEIENAFKASCVAKR